MVEFGLASAQSVSGFALRHKREVTLCCGLVGDLDETNQEV